MKIIIAAEIFPPDIGGPATYSKDLAEELVKAGWLVNLICYSDKIEKDDDLPFKVTRILRGQSTAKRYIQYFWHLLKLVNSGCDVIYAMGPVSSGLPAMIVGFLFSKKVFVKVVGDYAWEQARNLKQTDLGIDEFQKQKLTGKISLLKKIETFTCSKAYKVITPSEYLKEIVKGWGVPGDKIEVIYNSFNYSKFDFAADSNKDSNLIISIGRLVPWKGFDTLINLFPELLKEIPELRLMIIGEGPEREKLSDLVRDLNLDGRIIINALPHNLVLDNLSLAGIFVLNTGYEGLSHTVLEAMAAGTPVITTKIGGNPELIIDNENGLLVEYNNREQLKEAILKLYQSRELSQKFINNSKEVLKKFTKEEMIEKTKSFLKSSIE